MKKIILLVSLLAFFCPIRFIDSNVFATETQFLSSIERHSYEVENQRFLKFFENLKKELKAPNNVQLRFIEMEKINKLVDAFFVPDLHIIYVSDTLYKSYRDDPMLVAILVHELEHTRQCAKCSGSYHGKDSWKLEQGADAAVAGYFDCSVCLSKLTRARPIEKGYFGKDDYEPYIARAKEENKLCINHYKDYNSDFDHKCYNLLLGSKLTSMGIIAYYWKKLVGKTPYKNRFTKFGSKFCAAHIISSLGVFCMDTKIESFKENASLRNTNTAILQDAIEKLKENKEHYVNVEYKSKKSLCSDCDSQIAKIERELERRSNL